MVVGEKADEAGASPGPTPPAPPGRPFWPVALLLLGLIIAVLGAAYALDQRFRPRVGVEPAPTVSAAAEPTHVASGLGAQATTSAADERATTEASPTPGTTPSTPSVAATGSPPGTQAATSQSEREIEAAYYRFLQVYSEAVFNLDTSHLGDVLDGVALKWVTEEVNDRKARGRPLKVIEDERLIVFGQVTESEASLTDVYTSRSVVVDVISKQPMPRTSPPTRVRQVYVFRRTGGIWKVVDGTREVLEETSK